MKIKYLDPLFFSYIVSKLIKCLTRKGINEPFENYFYFLIKIFKNKFKLQNTVFFLFELIELIRPLLGLKRLSNTRQKNTVQNKYLPFILNTYQSYNLALKWLLTSAFLEVSNNFMLSLYKQIIIGLFSKEGYIFLKQKQYYSLITKYRYNKYYRW